MLSRILTLTLFLSLSSARGEDPSPSFAPEFFAFENGVRFSTAEEQIRVLQELGYDSLGSAKPQNLPARLKLHRDAGLRISSLYVGGKIGADKNLQAINPAIPAAIKQLEGHDTIIELYVQGGSQNTDEEAVAFVRDVADLAEASGLRVVLYPHAGFYVATVGDAVRIAELSEKRNVGVMFNLCHFLKVEPESDLRATLEGARELLWRVSTCGADVTGTSWETLIQPLDLGSFDQVALLRMLREIGFSGDVGLQCYAVKGDPENNLARSIAAWRNHLARSLKE